MVGACGVSEGEHILNIIVYLQHLNFNVEGLLYNLGQYWIVEQNFN